MGEMQDKDGIQDKEGSTLLLPIIPPPQCLLPPQYPQRSFTQDFMQRLHAFLNIKQLIRKADLGNEEEKREDKEKALTLALHNNFVTDLTSLVVIRPDMRPIISKLERPSLPSISSPSPSYYGAFLAYSAPALSSAYYYADYDSFYQDYIQEDDMNLNSTKSFSLVSTTTTNTYRPLRTSTESGVQD